MGTIRVKREPIKIPGRTAELISRTEARNHVIDDDRHFLVLEQETRLRLVTVTLMSTVFQEYNNDELGPPFRMHWSTPIESYADSFDWSGEVGCEPVRPEIVVTFVPDGGAEV